MTIKGAIDRIKEHKEIYSLSERNAIFITKALKSRVDERINFDFIRRRYMKFGTAKRKLHNLIEKLKLSESDYLSIKEKANKYDSMMSTITIDVSREYTDVTAKDMVIARLPKLNKISLNVDIKQMLSNSGITFDKNCIDINVIK